MEEFLAILSAILGLAFGLGFLYLGFWALNKLIKHYIDYAKKK